ncbi:MAG: glycosyltransferase family 4 protein [Candidatus Peribacteraceae bacterium]|nr:glycosyltransferase family 4 protein [Candidatus Peribacteraceae bacterium]MDD5742208.1 glycosyltransferase family 4 protein [Candidatus Peribacteraceae bacterium]
MKKTVCAFGFFDLEGQRSWVIRTGLEESGFDLRLCRTDARGFLPKIRELRRQWKNHRQAIDVLYVAFPGHHLMPLAWWIARKKGIPVVLDIFISLYETEVEDRARLGAWHPKAWMLWLIDRMACALADRILIDTEEHRDFFVRRYRVPVEKFLIIPVGCRTDLFSPQKRQQGAGAFLVRFHGSFIPLHGIETILKAARECKDDGIVFELAGKGQTFPAMQKLAEELRLTNIRFVGQKRLDEIPDFIAGADVCLGIFGTGAKAQRVIPTKAFEILAMGKPLITARTPATESAFRDRGHVLFVTPGDPTDLAAKIRELKSNPQLAASIAQSGRSLFLERFQPRTVVEPLVAWLNA